MTRIDSVVPAVDALVFWPLPPRRPVSGRVCRVHGAVVVVTEAGRVYSSEVQDRVAYLRGSAKFESTFAALVKLGVVSKADSDKWEAKRMLEGAKALGIKLTVAQRGQLLRVAMAAVKGGRRG